MKRGKMKRKKEKWEKMVKFKGNEKKGNREREREGYRQDKVEYEDIKPYIWGVVKLWS